MTGSLSSTNVLVGLLQTLGIWSLSQPLAENLTALRRTRNRLLVGVVVPRQIAHGIVVNDARCRRPRLRRAFFGLARRDAHPQNRRWRKADWELLLASAPLRWLSRQLISGHKTISIYQFG